MQEKNKHESHKHIYINICINTQVYMYIYIHTHKSSNFLFMAMRFTCMKCVYYECVYSCTHIYLQTHLHVYIHTHIQMHTLENIEARMNMSCHLERSSAQLPRPSRNEQCQALRDTLMNKYVCIYVYMRICVNAFKYTHGTPVLMCITTS
jgi:hypothetical protein